MISKFSAPTLYSKTNSNTHRMMHETIEIFEQVANFFIELLNHDRSFMTDKTVDYMELQIQQVVPILSSADAKAKDMSRVNPDDGDILHFPQTNEHLLPYIICNALLRLFTSSPRMPPESIGASLMASRNGGLILGDLDEETRRGLSSPVVAIKSKEGLTIPNLSNYLKFDTNVLRKDLERCSSVSVVKPPRQLLLQPAIVRTYDPELFNRHLLKGLKKKSLDTLSNVFKALIKQLRSTSMVVFCLIDSISYYEDPGREQDTREVLSLLNEIVASQRGRRRKDSDKVLFKLMITAGGKSVNAHRYFNSDGILEMNESVDGNTRLRLQSSVQVLPNNPEPEVRPSANACACGKKPGEETKQRFMITFAPRPKL
ncbi:hypothetical protein PG984_005199 [Apiospora sp. TS-2023a]